ncbi:MAG: VWA domain-containing protein [Burkholderiaceae bacterium]|nr:VWA domain-containing protein [Burkholderiaceae bacterium]
MDLIADLQAALGRFHFLRPAWLLAVPLLLALAAWLARRSATTGAWSSLIDAPLLGALRLHERQTPSASPWPWLGLAWTLAALALAGPTWQREPATAYSAPDGWVVVLDLSPSMVAQDVSPNRATRARYAIDDLLRSAQGTRIGLVVFGAEPYLVTPLTDDVATVRGLSGPLAPDLLPSAGDRLAPALAMAQQLLERTATNGGHVVVISDGFEDPAPALAAAESLRARKTTVDVVGIGTPTGALVPLPKGGFQQDAQGRIEIARLDSDLLQRLAGAGGGRAFALDQLPALISSLQSHATGTATQVDDVQAARWRDAGGWLLPAVLLLVAGLARRGWW